MAGDAKMTKQWNIDQLRALHQEWAATLDDDFNSGPYSEHSNGENYGLQFLSWLEARAAAEPPPTRSASAESIAAQIEAGGSGPDWGRR